MFVLIIKVLQHINLCLHVLVSYGLPTAVLHDRDVKCWDVGVTVRAGVKNQQTMGSKTVNWSCLDNSLNHTGKTGSQPHGGRSTGLTESRS